MNHKSFSPNPGHGYQIREILGQGKNKKVFRAICQEVWEDRALATYIDSKVDIDTVFKDMGPAMKVHSDYLVKIYQPFVGLDNRIYIPEELLDRTLSSLAPFKNLKEYLKIGRDLVRGLFELQKINRVHRDLKLDNCGLGYDWCGKICDFGLLTSEDSPQNGTILTRAPELLMDRKKCCNKLSDVWALGATLFALRTGFYPFVKTQEIDGRPSMGTGRTTFEKIVKTRCSEENAEKELLSAVDSFFDNKTAAVLKEMLVFNVQSRATGENLVILWENLYKDIIFSFDGNKKPIGTNIVNKFSEIECFLNGFINHEFSITEKKWQALCNEINEVLKDLDIKQKQILKNLLAKAKLNRESQEKTMVAL